MSEPTPPTRDARSEAGFDARADESVRRLQNRVAELEETLAAIQGGHVDALVVRVDGREQLFTLTGADTPYRVLIEQMREGALTVSGEGVILYANRRFAEMLGAPLERVTGARLADFAAGADAERLGDLNGLVGDGGRRELNLRRIDGTTLPAYVSASPLPDDNGPAGGQACVVITDLTEQKRAEALAVSERKSRLMVAVGDAIKDAAGAAGMVERVARVVTESFGVARCVLVRIEPDGRWAVQCEATRPGVAPIAGPDGSIDFGTDHFADALRSGRTVAVEEVAADDRVTPLARGRLASLGVRSLLYVPHPSGERPAVVLSLQDTRPRTWSAEDVTLMEQAADRVWAALKAERDAEALRASEDRFRQLADTIPHLAWIADADGAIYWYNRRWYEYTRATPEAMAGWGWASVHDPLVLPRVLEKWKAAIAAGTPFEMEFPLRGADGVYRPFLTFGVPLRDDAGRVVQWFGTNTDMSVQHQMLAEREQLLAAERIARAEAERVSRMKDDFVATLSHELRTPLNAILGWSQLVARPDADAVDVKLGLETIERNARVQVRMIEDLLDVSRISAGKVRLDVQRVGLCAVIEAALASARPAAEVRGIGLHQLLDCDADQVSGDPSRLQQVVWNLLSNAIKFTAKGGRVEVRLRRVGSIARLSVSDNGRGIAADFLPYVFDRFRQADQTTTRQVGGLGLGLAIVKQLVELHGGTIEASSAGEGLGATFVVDLPLGGDRSSARPAAAKGPHAAGAALLAGLCVVYVDDERDACELVRRVLADRGATVFVGGSAEEGRRLVAAHRPDVLVTDIGMPDEDGYGLIRSIRGLPPDAGGRTPAAAVTALARPEDRHRAILAGFQTHVAKPVEPAVLIEVVATLAGRAGAGG